MLPKFEVYMDRSGQYRWRLKARNGEIVAVSEAYTARYSAKRSAELVKAIASYAIVGDLAQDLFLVSFLKT